VTQPAVAATTQPTKPAPATKQAVKPASAARSEELVLPAAPARKPVTESFDGSTTAPAVNTTPSPVAPVAAEPQKPVTQDSSAAHP
jgi:hypothetical protein